MRKPTTQMEPLWTRLRAEREEDIEAKKEKSRADDREKRKADMKTCNEMMERREDEREADERKRMA
jgi:hypothetical protein